MFNLISAGLNIIGGVSSLVEGRKARKNAETTGEFNRISNLINGKLEGARSRAMSEAASIQSLISSEDLKVNALIVEANRRKARLEGDFQANKTMLEHDKLATQVAERKADITRNNLGITRERKLAQNKFQRETENIRFLKASESAVTKAKLASMGLSVTSGIASSIDSTFQREADRAVIEYSDQVLAVERAANKATTENIKRIERLERLAEEETSFLAFRANILRQETDIQDTILGLEAENLKRQSDYMVWNSKAATDLGEIEARILETGAQFRAASAVQTASAQASAASAQGFSGFASGMGGATTSIGRGIAQAKDRGATKFLGFNIG